MDDATVARNPWSVETWEPNFLCVKMEDPTENQELAQDEVPTIIMVLVIFLTPSGGYYIGWVQILRSQWLAMWTSQIVARHSLSAQKSCWSSIGTEKMEDLVHDPPRRMEWPKVSKVNLIMIGLTISTFLVMCLEMYLIVLHRRTLADIGNSVQMWSRSYGCAWE